MKNSKLNSAPPVYWKHGTTQTSAQNASNQWKVVTSATKTTHLSRTTSTRQAIDRSLLLRSIKEAQQNQPSTDNNTSPITMGEFFLPLQKGNTPLRKTRITNQQALDALAIRANCQTNMAQRPKPRTHLGQMIRIPNHFTQMKKTEHTIGQRRLSPMTPQRRQEPVIEHQQRNNSGKMLQFNLLPTCRPSQRDKR
jgi:hypothetical protein